MKKTKNGLNKMEKVLIGKRAKQVLDIISYDPTQDTYVDAVELANLFGFEVYESSDLLATDDGSISVSKNGTEKTILVNENRSVAFKRFVITHELAHYLLHYKEDGSLFKHREHIKGKGAEENDADYFAACILMPKDSFVREYKALKKNSTNIILDLFNKFFTPIESIERRIQEIC